METPSSSLLSDDAASSAITSIGTNYEISLCKEISCSLSILYGVRSSNVMALESGLICVMIWIFR